MPGEVNMTDTQWYVAMGEAVKERNRALSMVENWQEKVATAEQRITELAAQMPQTPLTTEAETPTEQV